MDSYAVHIDTAYLPISALARTSKTMRQELSFNTSTKCLAPSVVTPHDCRSSAERHTLKLNEHNTHLYTTQFLGWKWLSRHWMEYLYAWD